LVAFTDMIKCFGRYVYIAQHKVGDLRHASFFCAGTIAGKEVIWKEVSGRNRLKEVVLGKVMANLVIQVEDNKLKPDNTIFW